MSDYIDRQAVIDVLAEMQGLCTSKAALIQNSKIWQQIKDMPSAEVEPVKHGRWINDNHQRRCSICARPIIPINKIVIHGEVIWENNSPVNYCPYCGAKMDLECKDESN